MSVETRNDLRRRFPEFVDWMEDFPLTAAWPGWTGRSGFRIEERHDDHTLVVRAELPGLDPERDIKIEFTDATLTIEAERRDTRAENDWSEFRYGKFVRRISLPKGSDADQAAAKYASGILEITIPVTDSPRGSRRLEITKE